ncbi:MAG: tRNA pseudouridine(13) synthase TruD [Planctomycetota bacterium]|nr:tRNA pseudouridine(13) synthase TruD [Planctomycetota bacterium]
MEFKPTRPVPRGCAAGQFRGRYKVEPEDFVVDELPAYEPAGEGEHLWLWIEKRGMSTLDLCRDLGAAFRVDPRSIGVAGLKDARSISRQWLSVAGAKDQDAEGLGGEGWQVLRHVRHGNKLKMGHLRGNRFEITLRGTVPGDLEIARENLAELERVGVPNYFGEQRFGKRGANLDKGLRILRGGAKAMAARMPRRVFGLVVSAVQSEIFNRVIIQRLSSLGQLLPGDLAFLHRNGASFPVEDVAAEQARADAFEISPSGPMPGPKMSHPTGEPLEIEQQVLHEMDLDLQQFAGLPFGMARGERRPLRVPIADVQADAVELGLRLSFALPRGCFATTVLRELLVDSIWFQNKD